MYNKYLEVFIAVADTGSFSKAGEQLFISPTAVMKQMNLMESDLGLSLLNRTNHGISLTDVGKQIYKDAKFIIDYSNKAIKKAKKIQDKNTHFVTIGTSLMAPCKPLLDIWYKVNDKYPDFKINIVPFEENHANVLSTLHNNNVTLDFLVSPGDSKEWLKDFNFLKLGEYRFCIAVPISNPLSKKDEISFSDLSGEKVVAITTGNSKQNENIVEKLKANCKDIEIIGAPLYYDVELFNRCEENGYLLVTLECWKDIHPAFKTIPLSSGESMPYGAIYSKEPSDDALRFLDIIKEVISE